MKILCLAASICLVAAPPRELDRQVDQLTLQILDGLQDGKVATLAVVEFPNLDGKVSDLGRYLTEELTTCLFRTGRFKIVERQQLKRVLEEQKLAATGFLDEATAARLGRVLGVDALATGTLADLDTSVKINARILGSETGSVLSVATVTVPMTRELEKLLGRVPAVADAGRFDGTWEAYIACLSSGMAQGYTNRIPGVVKGGLLHAQIGTEGVAPCTSLDGRINPDGSATILATGLTGDPRFTLLHVPRGRAYSFHIEAIFTPTSGTGKRLEARPCSITFTKK